MDNALKAIELVKEAEEAGVDIDKVCASLEILNELDADLKFESNQDFGVATESNAVEDNEE